MPRTCHTLATFATLISLVSPEDRTYASDLIRTLVIDAETDGVKEGKEQAAQAPGPQPLNAQGFRDLITFVRTNQKIQTIKVLRTVLGMGLKEAKDLADSAWGPVTPSAY